MLDLEIGGVAVTVLRLPRFRGVRFWEGFPLRHSYDPRTMPHLGAHVQAIREVFIQGYSYEGFPKLEMAFCGVP